jgi:hypothetical protein
MVLRGTLIGLVVMGIVLVACGSANLAGNGADCFVTTDCQEGLVCVPQKNNTSKCSSDLTNIVGQLPAEGGVMEAAAAQEGGKTSTDGGGTPVKDTGSPVQDTGAPPKGDQ